MTFLNGTVADDVSMQISWYVVAIGSDGVLEHTDFLDSLPSG